MNPLEWLFSTDAFVPRQHCGDWPDWQIEAWQSSHLVIALSYLVISVGLAYLWVTSRHLLPKAWMVLGFSAFAFPAYRLFLLTSILCGAVSVGVALALPSVIRHVSQLPSIEQYQTALHEVERLTAEDHERIEARLTLLGADVDSMQVLAKALKPTEEFNHRVDDAKAQVQAIRKSIEQRKAVRLSGELRLR